MNTITEGSPYSHEEHSRTSYAAHECQTPSCAWCGAQPKTLFNYDGETRNRRPVLFCNQKCHDAYQGGDGAA